MAINGTSDSDNRAESSEICDQGGFKIEENDARGEMIQFSSLSQWQKKLLLVKGHEDSGGSSPPHDY
jgi:hypothetical protein